MKTRARGIAGAVLAGAVSAGALLAGCSGPDDLQVVNQYPFAICVRKEEVCGFFM